MQNLASAIECLEAVNEELKDRLISFREYEDLERYLKEYCSNRNRANNTVVVTDLQINEYGEYIDEYKKAVCYVDNIKNSNMMKSLRQETRKLKQVISNIGEDSKEELEGLKTLLKLDKKTLRTMRVFEDKMIDMMSIKVLKPIYHRKNMLKEGRRIL